MLASKKKDARFFLLEPSTTRTEILFEGFYVRGPFVVTETQNNPRLARAAWEVVRAAQATGTVDPRKTRRWVNRLAQLLMLARGEAEDEYRRAYANRASGDCICDTCGAEYSRHAVDPFATYLNVLCDEHRVKL